MADTRVRGTLIHPRGDAEERISRCVLRYFPSGMVVVSLPEADVPGWTGVDCGIVVGRGGNVVESFTVEDTSRIDLSEQTVTELPDWDGTVVSLYPR